jgi:CDP-diacylglycerol--serine O-phosphatidyltransferase
VKRVNPLPTLLTLSNMICGFGAMTLAMRAAEMARMERFEEVAFNHRAAVGLIFLAMVFDVLDGRIARMAGLSSRFGAELDSLSDVVSFGLAPAMLAKSLLDVSEWPTYVVRVGWVMLALYAAATAVRLARYNVEAIKPADGSVDKKGKDYFVGLPSPAAAGMAVSPVLLYYFFTAKQEGLGVEAKWVTLFLPLLMLLLAWLMVSRVRYMHLGNRLFSGRKRLWPVLLVLVALVMTVGFWQVAGTALFGVYVIGFLVWDLGRTAKAARERRKLRKAEARKAVAPAKATGTGGAAEAQPSAEGGEQ